MSDGQGPIFPTSRDGGAAQRPEYPVGRPAQRPEYPVDGGYPSTSTGYGGAPQMSPPGSPQSALPGPSRGVQSQHVAILTVGVLAVIAIVVVVVLLNRDGGEGPATSRDTQSDIQSGDSRNPPAPTTSTTTPSPPPDPGLAGIWVGEYRNTGRSSIQLTLTDPQLLNGTIVYFSQSPCTESWRETGRSGGLVYVDEERISGDPDDCWGAKWELTITGDTITGTMVQPGQGFGATIVLHKQT